jgi:hypothetical protein
MSLIRTLWGGMGTLGFVEGRLLTEVPAPRQRPTEAPSKAPAMSPLDELHLLEKTAMERGISEDALDQTRRIGDCPAQVQTRINHLHEWLAAH